MAYFDQSYLLERRNLRQRFAKLLQTPFDDRQQALANEVVRLRAMSDADLAARGIARENILFHVFGARRQA
ncbi:hypothetical protein [Pseudoprimorskyibacter insulae]|uniref:DUF1127 domain-containing protein n=1 Tax=Pseudoprimorskyibacter insulae TaxID=1695997 RepID=A0A2R8ARI7_9RHOB|nr:hypothetical protein [Pseudoprimorskyibacter insulae]SPF78474.1 hypothetical protein PRI8871_01077 [Pseudoprimorskyibacter insulae]